MRVLRDLRVTWRTAGGRTDSLQASRNITGSYSNVVSTLVIPGVGVVTTNYLEVGAATNTSRYYRVKLVP